MSLLENVKRWTLAAGVSLLALPAFAQDVALVISNPGTLRGGLANSVEEGHRELVSLYRDMGYAVYEREDLDRNGMRQALENFTDAVDIGDGKVVIHFSGRAVTIGEETLLVPLDLDASSRTRVLFDGVPLSALIATASEQGRDSAVILGLNENEDPEFKKFAEELKVRAPQDVLVMFGNAREVNASVRRDFLTLGLSARQVADRNSDVSLRGKVSRDLRLVPSGRRAADGLAHASEVLWALASASGDDALYEIYLERFPRGAHAREAERRLGINNFEENERKLALSDDARRRIQRDLTVLGYDTRGIDGIFGPGTRGSIRTWQKKRGFQGDGFLQRPHPAALREDANARRAEIKAAEQERQRRDTAYWGEMSNIDTKAALGRYLKRYPNGLHAAKAQRRLEKLRKQDAKTARGDDKKAWRAAREANTEQAYQRYLNRFADGNFRDQAEERIAELRVRADLDARASALRSEENALGLSTGSILVLEQRLLSVELQPGPVDGQITGDTRRALGRFQSSQGLEATGFFNQETVLTLLAVTDG